jgi:hypothetical protein
MLLQQLFSLIHPIDSKTEGRDKRGRRTEVMGNPEGETINDETWQSLIL